MAHWWYRFKWCTLSASARQDGRREGNLLQRIEWHQMGRQLDLWRMLVLGEGSF